MRSTYQAEFYLKEVDPVIDNLPNVIMVVNRGLWVLLANKRAGVFAGKSKAELLGRSVGESIGCVHSKPLPEACGLMPDCESCELDKAIVETFDKGVGQIGVESEITFIQWKTRKPSRRAGG